MYSCWGCCCCRCCRSYNMVNTAGCCRRCNNSCSNPNRAAFSLAFCTQQKKFNKNRLNFFHNCFYLPFYLTINRFLFFNVYFALVLFTLTKETSIYIYIPHAVNWFIFALSSQYLHFLCKLHTKFFNS